MSANVILTRDAGVEIPKLKQFHNAMAIANMPLEKGIAKLSGMDVYSISYPNLKNYDVYSNLHSSLMRFCKFAISKIKKKASKYDFCYVHFNETDIAGHDNKPREKAAFLEEIDKLFFKPLLEYAEKKKINVIVTSDHSLVCKIKAHTSDPVPYLFFNHDQKDDLEFTEANALKGSLDTIVGKELLKKYKFVL